MKLTASQLRRIIKEEVSRVLSESRTEDEIMADVESAGKEFIDAAANVAVLKMSGGPDTGGLVKRMETAKSKLDAIFVELQAIGKSEADITSMMASKFNPR